MKTIEEIIGQKLNGKKDEIGYHFPHDLEISIRDIIDIANSIVEELADNAGVLKTSSPPKIQRYMIGRDGSYYSVNKESILKYKTK